MSESPDRHERRYKPGLDIPEHKIEQLRGVIRRTPWLVVGTLFGALFIPAYPGQTETGLFIAIMLYCGAGMLVGMLIERLVRANDNPADSPVDDESSSENALRG